VSTSRGGHVLVTVTHVHRVAAADFGRRNNIVTLADDFDIRRLTNKVGS
jgi:hypothetical protein